MHVSQAQKEFIDYGDALYQSTSGVYEDHDFEGEKSIGDDKFGAIDWKRIKDMKCNWKACKNQMIIDRNFDPLDIKQGGLGDCWFLSALSVISSNLPNALK
jgi:hypothetical protein